MGGVKIMEALLFTITVAPILWIIEMLMLAKDDWTVSRRTPVSYLLGAKGNSFCSIFWGSSTVYLLCGCMVFVFWQGLVNFVLGLAYLAAGMRSVQGNYLIAVVIITTFGGSAYLIYWSACKTAVSVKNKVTSTEFKRVSKQSEAIKELYKVFKDKYCPIIK
jgi:hypothetical protein